MREAERASHPHLPLGVPDIDLHLAGAGLACGAVHEIYVSAHGDGPSGFGFAFALTALVMRARSGPVLLVGSRHSFRDFGVVHGHGLRQLGVDVARLLLVETHTDKDALWSMEEALRSQAVAAVIGTCEGNLDLTASRRLSLAAGLSGTPLILLRAPAKCGASASVTRWRIGAASPARDRFDAFASPRWSVLLERSRNGLPGHWLLEWDHAAYRFRLARGLADHPIVAGTGQEILRAAV